MFAVANTWVDVLRGVTEDDWGNPVDNQAIAATGVPAQIIVSQVLVTTNADQAPRLVQVVTGAVGSERDVRTGDQLRDTRHGITYTVVSATQENAIGRVPDLTLQLHRLT